MISHIEVCSRAKIESRKNIKDAAIISITNIGASDANIQQNNLNILRLKFDDIDPIWFAKIGANVDTTRIFNKALAEKIKKWTSNLIDDKQIYTLIIHCEMGVSRSGAIATAIQEFTGIKIISEETLIPNDYILEMMSNTFQHKETSRNFSFLNDFNDL